MLFRSVTALEPIRGLPLTLPEGLCKHSILGGEWVVLDKTTSTIVTPQQNPRFGQITVEPVINPFAHFYALRVHSPIPGMAPIFLSPLNRDLTRPVTAIDESANKEVCGHAVADWADNFFTGILRRRSRLVRLRQDYNI